MIYNILYNQYKQNAILRGFNFDLSKENFVNLVSSNCHYCGSAPEEKQHLKRYNKTETPVFTNGIDRIDSRLGYTITNCVPCCTVCNRMKLDYDLNFFHNHISKIYHYHKSLTTISKESTSQANGDGSGEYPVKDNDIV